MASDSTDVDLSMILNAPIQSYTYTIEMLCDLLEQPSVDETTVTRVSNILIKIGTELCLSPAGVDELAQTSFIPTTFSLLVSSALQYDKSMKLLDMYITLSLESFVASRDLFELDVARVARPGLFDETVRLIDALLPDASDETDPVQLKKVKFLGTRTELVEKLAKDVVPLFVDSGAYSSTSYHGLCIIMKLFGLCSSKFLADLLKSVNISSFLDVVFRDAPEVSAFALYTFELILNLSSEFVQSFIEEGVFFSIARLCYYHGRGVSEEDVDKDLAKHMRSRYFPSKSSNSGDETLSVLLEQLCDVTNSNAQREQQEDIFLSFLDHVLAKLSSSESEPSSTLALVEGGIIRLLVEYPSNTLRIRDFVRHLVSSSETMATIVQKLQTALSLPETFPRTPFSADILQLLIYLARIYIRDVIWEDRIESFAHGKVQDLDALKIWMQSVPEIELVNTKLTERLEQEMMRDSIPTWGKRLMVTYPFLFDLDARLKFFHLDAFGSLERPLASRRVVVSRDKILASASRMMKQYSRYDGVVAVQYEGEPGRGPGPSREFYTLLSHELQAAGTGMWREDSSGLFPRPCNIDKFSQVRDNFILLGRTVARALREGRALDLRFSKAFYQLIIGKELRVYDVLSFDQALGQTLIEFTALVRRKEYLESAGLECETLFRGTRIEDLCLDFTLPGYPDFVLGSGHDKEEIVTMENLKDYVSLVLDATIGSGISNQLDAFEYGFNQLFPIEKLEVFAEYELERLMCGQSERWSVEELVNNVKFGNGYTATSPPMVNLLEIIAEFDEKEQRAFLQFVTGAPRLPLGGFGSLNPALTIARTASTERLPTATTCVNYLKIPPYPSKEIMSQKLLYAIREGQGSFQFS